MARGAGSQRALSPNETLIIKALRKAGRPLGAYDLIGLLHSEGVSSPPTVYRALKRLTELGLTHRIESLNAFVSCAHGGHDGSAVFAICNDCGATSEFHLDEVGDLLGRWSRQQGFAVQSTMIELRGRCGACTSAASTAPD